MSKAILIDPTIPIVDEVEIDLESLPAIYNLIGCQHIEGHRLPGQSGDWFIIDEEGAIKDQPLPRFLLRGFLAGPITGRALVVSVDEEGNETSPRSSLMDVADMVQFEPRMP